MRLLPLLVVLLASAGCATSPPADIDNLCAIFRAQDGWYGDAASSRDTWGSPIPVLMAIVRQESAFRADAKPPRRKFLGFIPGPRPSSAYGYPQAKDTTWAEYRDSAGNFWAERDDFGDAVDFVGWYNFQSGRRSNIPPGDPYRLYLAYHEGHGGFNRGSYLGKQWLLDTARRVEGRAADYQAQLATCEAELSRPPGFFDRF